MGRLDDLIRLAGSYAPPSPMKELPLELHAASAAQLARASKKIDRTMGRMQGVVDQYGLYPIDRSAWDTNMLPRELRNSPNAQGYLVDPNDAVALQYPADLRAEAINVAKGFQVPNPLARHSLPTLAQPSVGIPTEPVVVAAFPKRKRLDGTAAGRAYQGATEKRPGLVAVAAGHPLSETDCEKTLLHELRHTLEGDSHLALPWQGYYDTRIPRRLYDEPTDSFFRYGPADKNYLGRVNEEAVRFADGRARYAQQFGRLINSNDEAEEAARLILANERGLGEGFWPHERVFYRAAREASPEIRAHQNMLLQRLLAVPVAAGAAGAAISDGE